MSRLDFTSAEVLAVGTPSNVNVDRAICAEIRINCIEKTIRAIFHKGDADRGSGLTAVRAVVDYNVDNSAGRYDAIMGIATNNPENLLPALERILLSAAITDGVLPAGAVA